MERFGVTRPHCIFDLFFERVPCPDASGGGDPCPDASGWLVESSYVVFLSRDKSKPGAWTRQDDTSSSKSVSVVQILRFSNGLARFIIESRLGKSLVKTTVVLMVGLCLHAPGAL